MERADILREIEQSRKKAFEEFLVDIGYKLSDGEKAEIAQKNAVWRQKQAENIGKIIKSPIVFVDKIRENKLKKEEEYYRKKIEEMLAKNR